MEQKVYFTNSKGDKLYGILSEPKAEKSTITILCHGRSSNKDSKSWKRLHEILEPKGLPTFRFDFYGHGESSGELEDANLTEALDDILRASNFVMSLGYKKIGLVGSSFGGTAAILAATRRPYKFLALKSPTSDYEEIEVNRVGWEGLKQAENTGLFTYITGEGEVKKVKFSFVEDYRKYDVYKEAPRIQCPTLIVHGDKDEVVPLGQSEKLASLIPNSHLEIIKGARHNYPSPDHFEAMVDSIAKFVGKYATSN